jgi:hypothetical protein
MHFHIDQILLWMVLITGTLDAGEMLFKRLRERRTEPRTPVVWPVFDSFMTATILLAISFGLFSLVGSFFPHAETVADRWTPSKIAEIAIFIVVVLASRLFRRSPERRLI